jgi:hypothetical protein
VLQCQYHQYIGATDMVTPVYWWNCASSTNRGRNTNVLQILRYSGFFKMLAAPIYKAYSSARVELKMDTHVFKMAAKFREKRTSITTMGAKTQTFAIFLSPLISHYPLLLNLLILSSASVPFTPMPVQV